MMASRKIEEWTENFEERSIHGQIVKVRILKPGVAEGAAPLGSDQEENSWETYLCHSTGKSYDRVRKDTQSYLYTCGWPR